jgi:hypothetical protein
MYTIGLSTSFSTYKNYYAVDPIFAYHIVSALVFVIYSHHRTCRYRKIRVLEIIIIPELNSKLKVDLQSMNRK